MRKATLWALWALVVELVPCPAMESPERGLARWRSTKTPGARVFTVRTDGPNKCVLAFRGSRPLGVEQWLNLAAPWVTASTTLVCPEDASNADPLPLAGVLPVMAQVGAFEGYLYGTFQDLVRATCWNDPGSDFTAPWHYEITGYSRGGALATVAAVGLAHANEGCGGSKDTYDVVTFGTPRFLTTSTVNLIVNAAWWRSINLTRYNTGGVLEAVWDSDRYMHLDTEAVIVGPDFKPTRYPALFDVPRTFLRDAPAIFAKRVDAVARCGTGAFFWEHLSYGALFTPPCGGPASTSNKSCAEYNRPWHRTQTVGCVDPAVAYRTLSAQVAALSA